MQIFGRMEGVGVFHDGKSGLRIACFFFFFFFFRFMIDTSIFLIKLSIVFPPHF